ncbi:hypothetical protein EOPP23_06820 [Endozoicomonas sp. OPT23]|uniref:hypothetical protein n=1 Tax=Endozoicomonas sp. OPT23 TaxID=2072845 RepID=UPI00129A62EE|nr:hypothetical protein [Endozoicomonas sp. OPT23]MRI32698.1 hypothetical protein [Endozoicomonas sp. OPT23]
MNHEAELCNEYNKFIKVNSLPEICAAELLAEADERNLSSKQVAYLKDFVRRWEAVDESDDRS